MEDRTKHKVEQLLKSARLRRTKARSDILGALLEAHQPLTREQISERIGACAPNKVTIYRAMETFVAADIVHKAFVQDRTWYFELSHHCTTDQCHPHFSCTSCGRTDCLHELSIPMTADSGGYIIQHQRVQLEGLCPKCSKSA
ncbi:MAG: hypothetical protein DRP66_04060 [Planctomycetota bacterium]|nr:MAG: hypothetical protein DRP66_04060 [Planctomycetota bacterium]